MTALQDASGIPIDNELVGIENDINNRKELQ